MRVKTAISEQLILEKITAFAPVRHRDVLTRHGRVRLRYLVSAGALALAMAVPLLAGVSSSVKGYTGASSSVAVAETSAEQAVAFAQNRLQRYSAEVSSRQVAAIVKPAISGPKEKTLEIGRGDTLAGLLRKAGVSVEDAYRAVQAMAEHLDPRDIRPGQKVYLRFDPIVEEGIGGYEFASLRMKVDPLKAVNLQRTGRDTFESMLEEQQPLTRVYARRAEIETSLFGSALKAGIPAAVVAGAIKAYSWDIDFQRDLRQGDSLEVMYEQQETPEGERVKVGDIVYARLSIDGQESAIYRFKMKNGDADYFTADGRSVRKALMKTPVDGARVSSGFGMRKHPVLGYSKMHKGMDFAAPRGTPIYAAGDGTIERMGPWNTYGNYVQVRHNSNLKTGYAHLNGFAKGLRAGARVKQGQVIGYVGTTGRSTGPHLHYEILVGGTQVNPQSVKLPQGETLAGEELKRFKAHMQKTAQQYAVLLGTRTVAAISGNNGSGG